MADGTDRDDSSPERPAPEAEPTTTEDRAGETAEPPADADRDADADALDEADADVPAEAGADELDEADADVLDETGADEPDEADADAPDEAESDTVSEPEADGADAAEAEHADDLGAVAPTDDTADTEPHADDDQPEQPDVENAAGGTDDASGDGAADVAPDESGDDADDASSDDVGDRTPDEGGDDVADRTPDEGGDDVADVTPDEGGDAADDLTSDEIGDDARGGATAEVPSDDASAATAAVASTDGDDPTEADEPVMDSVESDGDVDEPTEPAGPSQAEAAAEPHDDIPADDEPDGPPAREAAATVVMPPVDDAPTVVSPPRAPESSESTGPTAPAGSTAPTGPRTEVLTPYGSIAAQAPDKAPGAAPVRTSAFGGRDAAPATALGGAAASAAAAASAGPAVQGAAPQAPAAQSAATATLPPTSTGAAQPAARPFEHVPQAERPSSPLDVFEPQRHERRWPRRLAIAAGVLVVLGGAYVGASYALGDKVPRGATVAGVEIGGLSSAQAVAALDAQLDGATGTAIPVTVHGTSSSLDPAKAGLTFDADATVARLTGVDLSAPIRLWDHLVGVGDQPAVAAVDEAKLTAAIQALGRSTGKKAVDGSIVFVDGSAHETPAKDGWALDEDAARDVVRTSWLSGARPLDLPSKTVVPTITNDETDRAMSEIAEPLTGAPVSVQVDGKLAVLQPLQLAAAATIAPKDGSLQLTMDGAKLRADVLKQQPDLLTKPADATFTFKDDKPVLVPGKAGTQLDPAMLAAAVAGAAVADNRTVDVALTPTEPEDSTDALQKLGIKEIVSEFSTPLTAEKIRDINIKQGAKNITGTLVKPGETFSLGKALGEVDAAHGFVDAGAIVDGEHTDAMGGGLSQLSTTTYNAAYFAGFQILEHHPHSEWFTRYPEGRESTLFLPSMDMRWKNNTPTGALVQAWVADNRTYVRIWGTKYWTVQSTTGPRSGIVQPSTRYSQSKTCEPAAAGNPGFTVTVTRRTYLGGELKDTTSYTTRYKPQDKVVCGKPPTSTKGSAG